MPIWGGVRLERDRQGTFHRNGAADLAELRATKGAIYGKGKGKRPKSKKAGAR